MVQVHKSTVINAPVDQVWSILRDFNGHDRWHPAVADSSLEDGRATDMIGAVRSFHLAGGEHLREQLLSMSDRERSFSYCIVESPIPLLGYVAHVKLIPVTDGNATYWQWSSQFATPPGRETELATLVGDGVYEAGFEAIRDLLEDGVEPKVTTPVPQAADQPAATEALTVPATVRSTQMMASRAIVLRGYGDPSVLVTDTISVPPPPAGYCRIQHEAIGLNYIDVYCRAGRFDLVSPQAGIPGLEAAGRIVDVGEQVDEFAVGDRVAYATLPAGAYCEVRNLPANRLVRLPDDISADQAAASLVKGLTAHFLLHDIRPVQPGETILIHAAAGGVGLLLVQWAQALGARVIGTTSSQIKSDIALAHGCESVVNYTESDFVAAVMDLTAGRGADVIIDGVGQATFAGSVDALAQCGHLISYGQASGDIGNWDIDSLAMRSATVSRPNFAHYTDTAEKLARGSAALFAMLEQDKLQIRIDKRFDLAQAVEAHEWLQSRQSAGSNLLVP